MVRGRRADVQRVYLDTLEGRAAPDEGHVLSLHGAARAQTARPDRPIRTAHGARLCVLLLACVFASGCFVFDEIDKGNKILDKNSRRKSKPEPRAPRRTRHAAQAGDGWWANAKSLDGPAGRRGRDTRSSRAGSARRRVHAQGRLPVAGRAPELSQRASDFRCTARAARIDDATPPMRSLRT